MKPATMKSALIILCLFACGVALGVAWAKPARPLWTYHNGNTLLAQTADYRRGYFIGVVDGYMTGQVRRDEKDDRGAWLDACLTDGWTVGRAGREIENHFQASVRLYPNPAAAIVMDGLEKACGPK
ncbi:MAG: hypothetical protein VW268_05545 [Rhodospirillaceae bacterium]